MEKAPDAFRTISEVADDLDLPQHVLRFWETRFQQIKPLKRGGGRRYYRPGRHRAAARHPASALRRRLHDPRRAAHPEGSRHQVRAERLAAGRRPAGARRRGCRAGDRPNPRRCVRRRERARRAEADSAHRRLFGLLPSFLSSGIDEERLAESRAADTVGPSDHAVAGDDDPAFRERRQLAGGQLAQAAGHAARPAGMPQAARRGADRSKPESVALFDGSGMTGRAGSDAARHARADTHDTNRLSRDTPTIQPGPTIRGVNGKSEKNESDAAGVGRAGAKGRQAGGASARGSPVARRAARRARARVRSTTASTTGKSSSTRSTIRRSCAPSSACATTRASRPRSRPTASIPTTCRPTARRWSRI